MKQNAYIPNGLPLISDYELFRTAIDYYHALTMLPKAGSTRELRAEIEQALRAIDGEAASRGLSLPILDKEEIATPVAYA